MSTQITTAMVEQYKGNVQLLSQQRGSRLASAVRTETIVGKNGFFEQIGATAAVKRTTRHGDTPQVDTPHARRRVTPIDYDWADLIDSLDDTKLLISPASSYAINAGNAFGRAKDDAIIEAATGTAYTGVAGGTSTSFTSGNIIASASGGMTVAKIIEAKRLLDAGEVDPSIPRYLALNASALADLLALEKLTSSDYNTIKALVQGELDTWMGFKFILSERLDLTSNERSCLAWAEDGILLGVGADMKTRITERDDKNYALQVYCNMSIGATRMEEAKVVKILTAEA